MIYIKIGEQELQCITTLRVAITIQSKFRKPYMQVLENVEKLDLSEQIKLLYCGIELGEDKVKITEEEFKTLILDNEKYGIEGLITDLERFINALQYPGLSEEEIEKKLLEKVKKYKKIQNGI